VMLFETCGDPICMGFDAPMFTTMMVTEAHVAAPEPATIVLGGSALLLLLLAKSLRRF